MRCSDYFQLFERMFILVIGLVFALILLFLPHVLGRSQTAMLVQYEILERRFQLKRSAFSSKWGSGIGERFSLSGAYGGYPVSLYDHYHESKSGKTLWTSLSLEMLFAGELEILLEATDGDEQARFDRKAEFVKTESPIASYVIYSDSQAIGDRLLNESLRSRLEEFQGKGSFRLSKGFFEYRESGRILEDATRIRFQSALMILAELGDSVAELNRPLT